MSSRRCRSKSSFRPFETLESRKLLSTTQIDFSNFASTTGLVTNGYGSAATTTSNTLQLTDGAGDEARSALYGTKVPVTNFTSHFTYQVAQGQPGVDGEAEADGIAFVIDGGSTSDLGGNGSQLGYEGGTFGTSSVAIEFNLYNGGAFGSSLGFAQGGTATGNPQNTSPLDFHSGDVIDAAVTYNGTTLSVSLTDATTSQTFNASEAINLPQVVGGQTAYVGFTGGTGNDDSVQTINSFDFSGTGAAPTITSAASASPSPVTGTKTNLSITAVSNSGGTLSYAWSTLHVPPGAAAPTFKPNSSSSANAPVMHFFKAGTYVVRCTVTDSNGGSSVSDLSIVVKQTATQIKITPHKRTIAQKHTQQYGALVEDQFAHPLETQPTFTFAITKGSGVIDSETGLYTATGAVGHLVISAEADGLTGIAGATVIA
jgi:hypothetical protein